MLYLKLLLHLIVLLAKVLPPLLAIVLEQIQKCLILGIKFLFLRLSLLLFLLLPCLVEDVHVNVGGYTRVVLIISFLARRRLWCGTDATLCWHQTRLHWVDNALAVFAHALTETECFLSWLFFFTRFIPIKLRIPLILLSGHLLKHLVGFRAIKLVDIFF